MTEQRKGHIVVCGLDGLGLRTVEELRKLGEEVVVIASDASEGFVERALAMGAGFQRGNYRDEAVLRAACIDEARSLVITAGDDVGNIHAALAAQEINPRLRIILRIFNQDFGRRLEALFHNCEVLSSSAIAAPAFVSAALLQSWEQEISLGGKTLRVRNAQKDDPLAITPLARVSPEHGVQLFPARDDGLLYLTEARPEGRNSSARMKAAPRKGNGRAREVLSYLRAVTTGSDNRLGYTLLFLLALGVFSMLIFLIATNFDLVDAFYNTTAIVISGGLGDINPADAPLGLKLFGTLLMIMGATILTVFYALVTDAIVSVRLDKALGRSGVQMRDHVIVCGLGTIGYRVVTQLHQLGVPVVAAEKNENIRGISEMRRDGIHVMFADTRSPETLQVLNAAQAKCVVISTDDDAANLETALNARALNPKIRVVLRLFDADLASRVERAFNIHTSRSVSALAGPRFAASAVAQRVAATIPINPRVLIVAQTAIEQGSQAEGKTVAQLEAAFEGRVVMVEHNGSQTWGPSPGILLGANDDLAIVATRLGLVAALEITRA
ncbi:MAG TPA: NAD-binding protein [Chloroflexia bacterium]|nr:NAD-binding protein [Chloroflexia bacterium]